MSEPLTPYIKTSEMNFTDPNITMSDILAVFKNKSDAKRLKEIKAAIVAKFSSDSNSSLFDETHTNIEQSVERLIKEDKKDGDASLLIYTNGKYKQRRSKALPGGADVILQAKDFEGKAGECAVMSELLFQSYNVNRMMVDGGIDLVAFKDGNYFFYQVKTVGVSNGLIKVSIPIDNFDKNKGYASQMRYVIVARYKDLKDSKELDKNHFFVFNQDDIEREMHTRCIKRGEQYISIKIKFHELTGRPILYDEKECDADWYFNKFK